MWWNLGRKLAECMRSSDAEERSSSYFSSPNPAFCPLILTSLALNKEWRHHPSLSYLFPTPMLAWRSTASTQLKRQTKKTPSPNPADRRPQLRAAGQLTRCPKLSPLGPKGGTFGCACHVDQRAECRISVREPQQKLLQSAPTLKEYKCVL